MRGHAGTRGRAARAHGRQDARPPVREAARARSHRGMGPPGRGRAARGAGAGPWDARRGGARDAVWGPSVRDTGARSHTGASRRGSRGRAAGGAGRGAGAKPLGRAGKRRGGRARGAGGARGLHGSNTAREATLGHEAGPPGCTAAGTRGRRGAQSPGHGAARARASHQGSGRGAAGREARGARDAGTGPHGGEPPGRVGTRHGG
eukprot:XP_020404482.1 spidroin-1-like [Zea mays]